MFLLYTLKVIGVLAVTAVAELWALGHGLTAFMALPMLASMWYATRLYDARRRRARGDPS